MSAHLDSTGPSDVAVLLLTDPYRVFAIGDLLLLIGSVLLAVAVVLLLPGLLRVERRPPIDAFLWGGLTASVLASWAIVTVYAQGRARGGIDAVAATGGWTAAAFVLLVASLLYVVFVVRGSGRGARRGLAPVRWPLFATISLVGTGFLGQSVRGDERLVIAGLALMIVLLPLLGIVAYRDVAESFERWSRAVRASSTPTHGPLAADAAPFPPAPPNV